MSRCRAQAEGAEFGACPVSLVWLSRPCHRFSAALSAAASAAASTGTTTHTCTAPIHSAVASPGTTPGTTPGTPSHPDWSPGRTVVDQVMSSTPSLLHSNPSSIHFPLYVCCAHNRIGSHTNTVPTHAPGSSPPPHPPNTQTNTTRTFIITSLLYTGSMHTWIISSPSTHSPQIQTDCPALHTTAPTPGSTPPRFAQPVATPGLTQPACRGTNNSRLPLEAASPACTSMQGKM
eukprot:366170-Chlamydomonas_euryale.AAC.5